MIITLCDDGIKFFDISIIKNSKHTFHSLNLFLWETNLV